MIHKSYFLWITITSYIENWIKYSMSNSSLKLKKLNFQKYNEMKETHILLFISKSKEN